MEVIDGFKLRAEFYSLPYFENFRLSKSSLSRCLKMTLQLFRIERISVRLPKLPPNFKQLTSNTFVQTACDFDSHDDSPYFLVCS
jgi:hypothetical protein